MITEKYALATANPGKVNEMRSILSGLGIDVVTRDDLGIGFDIEETGTTFSENATLKAKAVCLASGIPSIADDSGLVVDALNGEPGVYSSSFGGDELSAQERCRYLLNKMKSFPNMEQRQAKFVCNIVCVFPNGDLLQATGECKGSITIKPAGINGFGYDPIFLPDGKVETMAELTSEEKNAISHRGGALRDFIKKLEVYKAGEGV